MQLRTKTSVRVPSFFGPFALAAGLLFVLLSSPALNSGSLPSRALTPSDQHRRLLFRAFLVSLFTVLPLGSIALFGPRRWGGTWLEHENRARATVMDERPIVTTSLMLLSQAKLLYP